MGKFSDSETISEEDFKGGEKLSQRKLVLSLIKKINDENFKRADNQVIETVKGLKIIDLRETRINGIRDLNTLLQPKYDDKMKERKKIFAKDLKRLEDNFQKACVVLEAEKKVDKKFKDMEEIKKEFFYWCKWLEEVGWVGLQKDSPEYDAYLERKHQIYQKLFDSLIFLLQRCDWLRSESEIE